MMQILTHWLRSTFLIAHLFILLPSAHSQTNDISGLAHNDHIHLPVNSELIHTLSQETSGMHQFEGRLLLAGRMEIFWYTWTLDDESEIRMKLEFIPEFEEIDKVPLVLYRDEPVKLPKRIEINDPEKALIQIFGVDLTKSIIKNQHSKTIKGTAEFSVYQTFVECDRRYFQANLRKFNADTAAEHFTYVHKKRCGD